VLLLRERNASETLDDSLRIASAAEGDVDLSGIVTVGSQVLEGTGARRWVGITGPNGLPFPEYQLIETSIFSIQMLFPFLLIINVRLLLRLLLRLLYERARYRQ
jgi:hypothetical protein